MNDGLNVKALKRRPVPAEISDGVEALFDKRDEHTDKPLFGRPEGDLEPRKTHFDIVIVGSGYGGAIAAAELAGAQDIYGNTMRVCVLERGGEHLPGMFPSRMSEIAGHLRFSSPSATAPRGLRDGLFDLRLGGDVNALVANGLGGGSLINAGVMAEPESTVFDHPGWPEAFRDPETRAGFYFRAKVMVGAARPGPYAGDNQMDSDKNRPVPKLDALKALAGSARGAKVVIPGISMSIDQTGKPPGSLLEPGTCNLCGDCATGCNHGAKNSLDTNLLQIAKKNGAEIYTGATVLRVERSTRQNAWCLEVVHTEEKLRKRQGGPFKIFASKVILAAGTFGSTEILLRSSSDDLPLSARLGQGFSANGDQIAGLYNQDGGADVNTVVDEMLPLLARKVGPTINGMVKVDTESGPVVVEELAIPGALKRVFDEVITTSNILHTLDKYDERVHHRWDEDPCAIDPEALSRTSIFALMGHDGADGAIELVGGAAEADGDGAVRVRWPEIREHPLFSAQVKVLSDLANPEKGGVGGTVIPNPMWQFVPESMRMLFDDRRGPIFTVHPLGGCPMGPTPRTGVVNQIGQVFDVAPEIDRDDGAKAEDDKAESPRVRTKKLERDDRHKQVWPDLVVLDGSILPTSLAINPALTIAALALHSVEALRREWNLTESGATPRLDPPPKDFHPRIVTAAPSRFELFERLYGNVTLITNDRLKEDCVVELTLKFNPFPLTHITGREKVPLEVEPKESLLRIYRESDWREARRLGWPEERFAQSASITASVSGNLTTFVREQTRPGRRTWWALWAWWRNRGARDTWQWLFGPPRKGDSTRDTSAKVVKPVEPAAPAKGFWARLGQWFRTRWERLKAGIATGVQRAKNAYALASHAGEVRRFEYDLTLGKIEQVPGKTLRIPALLAGAKILGVKRFTYGRRANPWRQLMEMSFEDYRPIEDEKKVDPFPGLHRRGPRTLELDMKYLGEKGVPLFRIADQPDQPTALGDLAALLGYLTRVMLKVHVWTFRRPDAQDPREPQRLPGLLPKWLWGYHTPAVTQLEVDQLPDGTLVHARLSNYRPRRPSAEPPVVMIHGYSTSGTTFAHHAVKPNLTTHFLARKRDVWILDLRLSSGMPSARHPWSFEDAGLVDIPAALAHVYRETGKKIDVIAHCMGAAMFSMAVLARPEPGDKFSREREALPSMINRVVLSQVGPVVEFSPANVLRSYVLSYLRNFLPIERYEFKVGPDPSLGDQLLDRLLYSLPYPVEEFDRENPTWWMPWRRATFVGTRHRMDALYARDMNLKNMSSKALDHIDDLFGPLSLDTVSQAVHFAKHKVITNRAGRNVFVSRRQLKTRWRFPTLSLHGRDNGLLDFASAAHMERAFTDAGLNLLTTRVMPGFGHQDSLIGKRAGEVFEAMSSFLEAPAEAIRKERLSTTSAVTARVPWIGPHRGAPIEDGRIPIRAATDPGPNKAGFVALLPVRASPDRKRFEPAHTPEGEAVVRLHAAPQDRDGWVRLMLPLDPVWVGDAEGVLMLFLHDAPGQVQRALFSPRYRKLREILRGQELRLDGTFKLSLGAYFANRPWASRLVLNYFRKVVKSVEAAMGEALERPRAELEPALLEITRPDPARPALCFAVASCQYPPGLLDGEVADASMARLAKQLDSPGSARPEFLLLLGDQVYVDATAGLFDPSTKDDRYVRTYERTYQRKGLQSVLRRLPSYMQLDDHEIDDNFERSVDDVRDDPRLIDGRRSYWRYQRFLSFAKQGLIGSFPRNKDRDPDLSWAFKENGLPFFMADTRSRREARTAKSVMGAKLMADSEFSALTKWLTKQHNDARYLPKFVASPAILLPRHLWASRTGSERSALRSDGWDGYPASFYALLAHIVDEGIPNVVFLSGDEHLSCVATATLRVAGKKETVTVHSIHSSGLYSPFPFANAQRLELLENDHFEFSVSNRSYECDVETKFATPGDGYAVICLDQVSAPRLTYQFHRDYDTMPRSLPLVTDPGPANQPAPAEAITM